MSILLDELRAKHSLAHRRLQETTVKLQAAQQEHQSATQELGSITFLIQTYSQREQAERAAEEAAQKSTAFTIPVQITTKASEAKTESTASEPLEQNETNKTDLVRDQLKSHPSGIRPAEVWQALKNQIPRRSYVYAVLGRLKARDEATVRRGKYFYRVNAAKDHQRQEGQITIQ